MVPTKTNDRPGATPSEVIQAVEVNEKFREQVEHYCTVTQYTLFNTIESNNVSVGK